MRDKKVILRDLLLKHPADVAEVLSQLSEEQAVELVHRLSLRQAAAEPLGEMEPEDSAELLTELDREEAIRILSRMNFLKPSSGNSCLASIEKRPRFCLICLPIHPTLPVD